jgi:arylsulfatase A-like enzyme
VSKRNIIIISLDEVRPDHLSCYGYKKINTPNIDQVSKEGVHFETCISSSDFTPVAMGTVITGKYPNKHGMRDAYSYINGPSIAEILKENGYTTAGLVGNGLLSERHGFSKGFDFWNEASKETSWLEVVYPEGEDKEMVYEGNYWVEEFFRWLENNYNKSFFIWGHLYETHEGSEHSLLEKGLIKEGELSELGYQDAKIKMADEKLIGRILETLDELKISENTTLVLMSDHGTNNGEHPAKPIPWRKGNVMYPQHTTMYDHDLRVFMIMRGEGLPKGKTVKGMVRSLDLIPTLFDLAGISYKKYDFDGKSLLPEITRGESKGKEVYSEDLFEARGLGAIHSIRTDDLKFIRNLTLGTEEYYNLKKDLQEKNNIKETVDTQELIGLRKTLNSFLMTKPLAQGKTFSREEKAAIDSRLRALGYIE